MLSNSEIEGVFFFLHMFWLNCIFKLLKNFKKWQTPFLTTEIFITEWKNHQTTKIPYAKFLVQPGFEPGAPNPKSAMLAPRPKFHENCWKKGKILDQVLKNSNFKHYFIANWENNFIKMSKSFEFKLSLNFYSGGFIFLEIRTKTMEGWLVRSHCHVD